MSPWLNLKIPEKLIGAERISGNDYIKTYRTEILLPSSSEYAGYCFLHPSKLISFGSPIASITYNETFTFELIKKDREPGRRYKRYTLTVSELLAVYEPEVLKLKTQLENKEKKRLSVVGDVLALECRAHNRYYAKFVFQNGKKMFNGRGIKFQYSDEIYKSRVVANGISRKQFESIAPKLDGLCEEYQAIQDVRYTINCGASSDSSDKAISIYNSFYDLSDQWEEKFYKAAHNILENIKLAKE